MKRKTRPEQKRPFDWFRLASLVVALVLATLPLTVQGSTIALYSMMKYVTKDIRGDIFYVIKQGAQISLSGGTYTLPGGYWGIACRGANGANNSGSSHGTPGNGGSAQGAFYVAGDSFSLVINTVAGGAGSGSDAQSGSAGGAAQNVTAAGTRVAFAGGGGGHGDEGGYNGGNGGTVNDGTARAVAGGNGSKGGSSGGAANDFSTGADSLVTGSCPPLNDGGAGGGGGGNRPNRSSNDGGGGGSSYCQRTFASVNPGTGRYTGAPGIPAHGTVNLIYLGEVLPGTAW